MQCPYPITLTSPQKSLSKISMFDRQVPCGKCGACRANYVQDWIFRLQWESKSPSTISTAFLTLTYADPHLSFINPETGECLVRSTLMPKELSDFIKRLRRHHTYHYPDRYKKSKSNPEPTRLRYFAIGEYGTQKQRPHYHIIIYNIHSDLLQVDEKFHDMRINHKLLKIWNRGYVDVGTVTSGSIAYCAEFHMLPNDRFQEDGRYKEYATMSRRPYLGKYYVEKNAETHRKNLNTFVHTGQYKKRMPRTLKNHIFDNEELLFEANARATRKQQEQYLTKINNLSQHYDNPEEIIQQSDKNRAERARKRALEKGKK